jgi:hypothetical protein
VVAAPASISESMAPQRPAQEAHREVRILSASGPWHSFTPVITQGTSDRILCTIASPLGSGQLREVPALRAYPGGSGCRSSIQSGQVAYDHVRAVTRSARPGTRIGCVSVRFAEAKGTL